MRYRRSEVFTRRKRHVGRWIVLLLLAAVVAISIQTVVDNGRAVMLEQRVFVSNLPKELEGFTVLHISDLNGKRFGPSQKQVQNVLKGKRYNAVVITGDMLGKKGDMSPFLELLSVLDSTKPVYFIAGDSDPQPVGNQDAGYYTVLADWVATAQSRGAVFLDAPASLNVGKARVWFSDASQLSLDLDTAETAYAAQNTREGEYRLEAIRRTKLARMNMAEDNLHITLTHNPLGSDAIARMLGTGDEEINAFVRSVDVILAGGTAGGQWRIPGIGPVWANGWFPDDESVRGYHRTSNLLQYISGGLDVSSASPLPAFRLLNTPEMTLITFTAQMEEDSMPDL